MWPRLSLSDARTVVSCLGALAQLFGASMAIPLLVALASQEWEPAARYLFSGGLCLTVGSALRLARLRPGRITRPQSIALTGLAWIALSLLAAVPLCLSGHFGAYFDALFESVSGLTTTGVSLAVDLPHLSNADNTWRFMTQLVGGVGLIVVALSLGLFGHRVDASLYTSEARMENFIPNVASTARFIARVTLGFIAAAAVVLGALCLAAGLSPDRAGLHGLWLAIASFATGGFSPMPASAAYYHSFPLEIALMVFMMLGALNFALFLELRRGSISELARDTELRVIALWLAVMTVLFTAAACVSPLTSNLGMLLRQGLFSVVSTFTTTGFQTLTTAQLMDLVPSGALLVLVLLMAVGGCAGSTAGGLKAHRLGILAKSLALACKTAIAPRAVRQSAEYHHFGPRPITAEVSREAMTIFVLFVVTCLVGILAGVAHGRDGLEALVDSVVMTSNGGISSGIVSVSMPTDLEAIYLVQMLAGRLEFVTFIALVAEVALAFVPRRRTLRPQPRP